MATTDPTSSRSRARGAWSLSREPALILMGVVGPAVALVVSFVDGMSPALQTGVNAVAVAAAGVATAVIVKGDKLAPALLGLAQALVTLALGAGWNLTPDQQAGWITVVGIVVAAFVRTQVTAPVDALGGPRSGPVHLLNEAA